MDLVWRGMYDTTIILFVLRDMHAATLNKHRWNVNLLFFYFFIFHKGDNMIHLRDGNRMFPKHLELLGRELPEVGTEQLGALDVVGAVQLLVDGVGTV